MFQLLWPYRAIILSVCMLGLTLSGCGGGGDAQELSEGEVLRVSCTPARPSAMPSIRHRPTIRL